MELIIFIIELIIAVVAKFRKKQRNLENLLRFIKG